MPEPTTQWLCDSCGEFIERAEVGWVEWLTVPRAGDGPPRGRGIRVVHHVSAGAGRTGCQYRSSEVPAGSGVGDAALTEYLGPDGLMILLMKIEEQAFPTPELLEVIKRLHVPGYERARKHFVRAVADGVIDPWLAPRYWLQDDIQRTLDMVDEVQQDDD